MEKLIFSIILLLIGLFTMGIAIFGKKKTIHDYNSGIPTDFGEFLLTGLLKLFPSLVRRIFIFLLGAAVVGFGVYLLLY